MTYLSKRALISFDDLCPYQCKHCYTLDIPRSSENRTINELVESLSSFEFDIVYVSQRRENFVNPDNGIKLCESIFERYKCNIFMITRNVFDKAHLERLHRLKKQMEVEGKYLFVGVSLFATHSYKLSENPSCVPSPYERIEFLKTLADEGFYTVTLIRPVFPDNIIPIKELYEIVDGCKGNSHNCIASSGLAVNKNILWRLGIDESTLDYVSDVRYLEGAMEGHLDFVNVSHELTLLKEYCINQDVPFFAHTLSALNHLIKEALDGE